MITITRHLEEKYGQVGHNAGQYDAMLACGKPMILADLTGLYFLHQ